MHPEILSRRTFVASTAAALAFGQKGPNDQVVVGMIGTGNQGTGRLREFLRQPDVRIGAICDVDRSHLDRAIARPPLTVRYTRTNAMVVPGLGTKN